MSYTAKSVILDILDNYGNVNYLAIRSVDFWYDGSKISNPSTSFTAYATSYADFASYKGYPYCAFDTTLSKLGGGSYTTWTSNHQVNTNQRLICVFDSAITFDEIRINNYHDSGANTSYGANNVKISISTDAITSTVYNAAISNSTLIYDSTFDEHVASDVEDEQILVLTGGTTYTVTYDGNTSDGGTVPTDSNDYSESDTVTVLGNTGSLTKTGYTFSGWNTAANGSGTTYAADDTFSMPAENITLYAVWAEDSTVSVTTSAAAEVNSRSAILQGSLDDLGGEASVDVYFEYGPDTGYGSTTTALTMTATGNFSARITDFDEETTYHFRAVADTGSPQTTGSDASLTTLACPFELTATPALTSILWDWIDMSTPDGAPDDWSGNFITVGYDHEINGYDYESLEEGIAAAVTGDIILCYGADVLEDKSAYTHLLIENKTLYIRGVGTMKRLIMGATAYTDSTISPGSGSNLFFENVWLRQTATDYRSPLRPRSNAVVTLNKCKLSCAFWGATVYGYDSPNEFTGTLDIDNCELIEGQQHFSNINLSLISLAKVELDTALSTSDTTGSFAESDYVATPTAEYGPDYGTLVITDEFLASYGY